MLGRYSYGSSLFCRSSPTYITIKNLDLESHLSLNLVLLAHDRYNGSDLVKNMILDLHVVDVLDCILVINIGQTTSSVSLL